MSQWCFVLVTAALLTLPTWAQEVDTTADAIARRMVEASGGQQAWESIAFLRFNYKLYSERDLNFGVQHLWDKKLGIYRMEIPGPAKEPYVAVFYTDTLEGTVYWNGSELIDKDAEIIMDRIIRRYHHDLFFLSAPFMLFDPGVSHTYVEDDSDPSVDVIQVTFPERKGLPATSFRFHADRESGRLIRTSYVLPNGERRSYVWIEYEAYAAGSGSVVLATQRRAEGLPFLIQFDRIIMPPLVEMDLMRRPTPVLQAVAPGTEPEEGG